MRKKTVSEKDRNLAELLSEDVNDDLRMRRLTKKLSKMKNLGFS